MRKAKRAGLALALGALALAGCAKHADNAAQAQTPYDPFVGKTFPLTPAVIAMRWQRLNPDVESFMFRDMDRVFESRPVARSGAVWDLPGASGFAMPKDLAGGQSYDYAQFAERTYTNAFLVLRHGKVMFEDYRNRSVPTTRFLSMSMAKTVTSMLVGIALSEHKLASLDDPAEKYVPELKGSGYDGVTIRQILQMRSGIDYEERYDFGDAPELRRQASRTGDRAQQDALCRRRARNHAQERARQHVQLFDARHDGARAGFSKTRPARSSKIIQARSCGRRSAPRPTPSGSPTARRALAARSTGMGFNADPARFRAARADDARWRQARRYADPAAPAGSGK